MPDPRRLRQLGITSAAISASAVALMFGAAGPADAATTSTGTTSAACPVGHDPASTLKAIQCHLEQARKSLEKKINDLTHPAPAKKPTAGTGKANAPAKKSDGGAKKSGQGSGHAATPSTPSNVSVPDTTGLTPTGTRPQSVPQLPALTEQPQVAGQSVTTLASVPQTHLISPAAATADISRDQLSPVAVAGASGVAGAVVALNLSYATRRYRRRYR